MMLMRYLAAFSILIVSAVSVKLIDDMVNFYSEILK